MVRTPALDCCICHSGIIAATWQAKAVSVRGIVQRSARAASTKKIRHRAQIFGVSTLFHGHVGQHGVAVAALRMDVAAAGCTG
jgi:hypothetical protein